MWKGLSIGDVLAHRYHILECIGEGGMGKVYTAEDTKLPGKVWAVKENISAPYDAGRSRSEMEMLLMLDHPQLPKLVDYYHFSDIGRTYLIMEYVKGRTITDIVTAQGRLQEEEVMRIGLAMCNILIYLHSREPEPIIHRDLKPGNVIIDERNEVRLIDFGISRTYKPNQPHDTVRLGSPGFLAPEQLIGIASDARTDIYQLGALLAYMLSGGKVWTETKEEDWDRHVGEISAGLRSLLIRMLSQRMEDRPASASIVRDELLALQSVRKRATDERSSRRHEPAPGQEQRLGYIVVGALYSGAGATKTAFGLAEAIAESGMSCSVVEYAREPELIFRLGGVEAAPEEYLYLTERIADHSSKEWKQGRILYYPMNPEQDGSSLLTEQWYRALLLLRTDAVIIDVGSCWFDPFVSDLINRADRVVCAVDSQLHKWFRRDTERAMELLVPMQSDRGSVSIVAYQLETDHAPWSMFPMPIDLKVLHSAKRHVPGGFYAALLNRWGVRGGKKRGGWWRRSSSFLFSSK